MARPREFDPDEALAKAMHLFWLKGYCATSLDDLETGTGLRRQSLYGAFGDKRSLFIKTLKFYRERSIAFVREQFVQPASPKEALMATVHHLARGTVVEGKRCGCFMANTALELADRDAEIAAEMRQMFGGLEDYLTEAIEKCQKYGEISKHYSSRLLAKFILNSINGLRIFEKTQPSEEEIEDLVGVVLSVLEP